MFIACAFLFSVLVFNFCVICFSCMEWVYSIGLDKRGFVDSSDLILASLVFQIVLLCAYHFHGRMSQ